MKTPLLTSTTLLLGTLFVFSTVSAEVVIIGHAKSVGTLDAKSAKKLYLGKTNSISGMASVTLIGQADSSPTKAEFTVKATKKNLSKYKAYWSKMIFSGKAVPPKEMANDDEVKAYVASHTDAVGYINASAVDASVKVLLKLP